jgi:SAM-dependent methyltransferase
MNDWVIGFFDQRYRALYGELLGPERSESEVADLVALLGLPEGARLLDLCCGDGRHAVPLQRRGFRVCGLDLAPDMITEARRRALRVLGDPAEEAPELEGDRPAAAQPLWVRAEAQRPPLRPVFDAVLLLYNSFVFGDRAEARAILRGARAVLRPGGQLLLDCAHRDALVRRVPPGGQRETVALRLGPVEVHRWIEAEDGLAWASLRFGEQGLPREKRLRHLLFTATEVREMLQEAGFSSVQLYSDYRRGPFDYSNELLVAHART